MIARSGWWFASGSAGSSAHWGSASRATTCTSRDNAMIVTQRQECLPPVRGAGDMGASATDMKMIKRVEERVHRAKITRACAVDRTSRATALSYSQRRPIIASPPQETI